MGRVYVNCVRKFLRAADINSVVVGGGLNMRPKGRRLLVTSLDTVTHKMATLYSTQSATCTELIQTVMNKADLSIILSILAFTC